MSASGTISNLQQALNCAGKCNCCANLQTQINQLKAQIANIKPVDENRIIEATLLKVDPKIAVATAAVSTAISAKFDPRIREALEKAFGANRKAETVGEQQLRFQQEYQAGIREAKAEAKAAKTKADAVEPIANKAQSDGAKALSETEIAQRVANEAKKESANSKFVADRAENTSKTAKDIADIAAKESELYKNLTNQVKVRADSAYRLAENTAGEVKQVSSKVGRLESGLETVRGIAQKGANVAQDALGKAGKAIGDAAESIGISRRVQSELVQQGLKLGSLALRVADLASLVIEVLVSVGLAEALGARVDAVERGQQQLSDDISKILGRWIPEIRGLAKQAGLDASFARQLASSLSQGVSSALSQSSLALAGVRQASADATKAIAISAAVSVAVGTSINLATRALTGANTATNLATQASTKADTALKQSTGWQSPVKALQERISKLRNGINGKDGKNGLNGKPGTQGLRGIQGIQGIQGRPGITQVIQVPGIPGRPGRDGLPGRNGLNGINGRNGRDGIDVNQADVQAIKSQLNNIQNSQTRIQNTVINNNTSNPADSGLLRAIFSTVVTINGTLGVPIPKPNGGGVYTTNNYLQESFTRTFKFFSWAVLDRVLNLLVLATTIHNAAMLSNNLGQTLLSAIGNILQVFGIKDSDGTGYDIGDIIGRTIETLIKNLIGTDNYTVLSTNWKKANRIYQATANLLNSIQSIGYSILSALETVGSWVASIGNGLRKWGEVGETAYRWMNPTPNFQNKFFTTLENVENVVSQIDSVASEVLSVQETVTQIGQQKEQFTKALGEEPNSKQGTTPPEAAQVKAGFDASKLVSATGLAITDNDKEADE